MARTEPRAYLRFIVDEWPLIEAIFERCRQGPLQPAALHQLVLDSKTPNVTQRLLDEGIIAQLPNSPAYEMGEFVQTLIAHLRKEHRLGLAGEIRVYTEDLEAQTAKIVQALEKPDYEGLHRHADLLASRIKSIRRHLQTNGEAVTDMVVRAKTRKRHTPLRQRYGEVLEAWESYIEPVQQMADPSGPFEALFERLERELLHAIRRLSSHGHLVSERRNFEVLLYRLMALRSDLVNHLAESRSELLPLVREVRRNSTSARGASIILKDLRAKSVSQVPIEEWVRISRRRSPTAIAGVAAIEEYLAGVSEYTPEAVPFVWQSDRAAVRPVHISEEEVLARLRADRPLPDLLDWLIANWGGKGDTEDLLALFFTCRNTAEDMGFVKEERAGYETRTHTIKAPRIRVLPAMGSED